MNELNIALTAIGGTVLFLTLASKLIEEKNFSVPLAALLIGILIGPLGIGVLNLSISGTQDSVLEQSSRVILGLALMGTAMRLPRGYPIKNIKPLTVVLGLGMPIIWLIGSLLTYLILDLPLWISFLIGAVATPTDPVISSAIVTSDVARKNIPSRLRLLFSAEAGANDGLAYPLVLLPISLATLYQSSPLIQWFTWTVLWGVVGAVALGSAIGYITGLALNYAKSKGTIEDGTYLVASSALALLTLGFVKLLGSDGILAVFFAGIAFVISDRSDGIKEEVRFIETLSFFFTIPGFALVGIALPLESWLALGWKGVLLSISLVLLHRMPAMLALKPLLPQLKHSDDALFFGWFGPIGIGALFYASLAMRLKGLEEVWTVSSMLICTSVLLHSLTANPLSQIYARRHPPGES